MPNNRIVVFRQQREVEAAEAAVTGLMEHLRQHFPDDAEGDSARDVHDMYMMAVDALEAELTGRRAAEVVPFTLRGAAVAILDDANRLADLGIKPQPDSEEWGLVAHMARVQAGVTSYPSELEAATVAYIKSALYEVAEDGDPDKEAPIEEDGFRREISPAENAALVIESNTGADMEVARNFVAWYQAGVQMGLATMSHLMLAEAVAETLVQGFCAENTTVNAE